MRYGLDGGPAEPLKDVAQALGVSRARAYQIVNEASRRLRRLRRKTPGPSAAAGKEQNQNEGPICLDSPIERLKLSTRSFNGLREANIRNIADLTACCPKDVALIRNLGRVALAEIQDALDSVGFHLSPDSILDVPREVKAQVYPHGNTHMKNRPYTLQYKCPHCGHTQRHWWSDRDRRRSTERCGTCLRLVNLTQEWYGERVYSCP